MTREIVVPELGESVVEATVGEWLKNVGDSIQIGDVVVELETDKVDVEVGATAAGTLAEILQPAGTDVQIGQTLGLIEENGQAPAAEEPAATESPSEVQPATTGEPQSQESGPESTTTAERATPVAKRLAAAEGIDLAAIEGTGTGGRVTRRDVESRTRVAAPEESAPPPTTETARPTAAVKKQQSVEGERPEERIHMSRRRRTIASRLVEAQQTAAMLTTFNEIDMTAVMETRKQHQEGFVARNGVKLGFTSFFVKASVSALKAFPRLNAEIDGDDMILKYYYDIGIAVGAEEGLVVPVLRDADAMSFAEIEQEVKGFGQRANTGKLTLDDLRGGTFTITNGGVFGSMLSTPILNPPQVGILGLHNIQERPVVVGGEIVIRPIMYVALTYDHRIVDGREAVQFLVRLKQLIEDPVAMLIED